MQHLLDNFYNWLKVKLQSYSKIIPKYFLIFLELHSKAFNIEIGNIINFTDLLLISLKILNRMIRGFFENFFFCFKCFLVGKK